MSKSINVTIQCADYDEKIIMHYRVTKQFKFTRLHAKFHGDKFIIDHEIHIDDCFITNIIRTLDDNGQEDFYRWDQEFLLDDFSIFRAIENELSELIVWHFQYLIKNITIKND